MTHELSYRCFFLKLTPKISSTPRFITSAFVLFVSVVTLSSQISLTFASATLIPFAGRNFMI